MSLDGGGISNSPGAQDTASAMEEDYCLHARQRFQHQWMQTGVFHAGALRQYGVTGEPLLLRSIKQTRMLGATFGTCFLGHFPVPPTTSENDHVAAAVAADPSRGSVKNEAQKGLDGTVDGNEQADLPFRTLLLGPVRAPAMSVHPQLEVDAWRRAVANSWEVLQMPSEWCQAMNGVVTETNWCTAPQRTRIREQLELASFMCLRAVQVPLPFYSKELPWCEEDDKADKEGSGSSDHLSSTLSPEEEVQRSIQVVCLAADMLLDFIQHNTSVKVWVRCDGCNPAHRYQMQRLRHAVLYGYTTQTAANGQTVYALRPACGVSGVQRSAGATVRTEAVASLMTLLYFSSWHPRMLLPSEWLGEQVVCFECPPAALLFACLAPHGVAPAEHPHFRPDVAADGDDAADTSTFIAPSVTDDHGDPHDALAGADDVEEGEGGDLTENNNQEGVRGERDSRRTSHQRHPSLPSHNHHSHPPPHHHDGHRLSVPYNNLSRRSSPAQLPELDDNNDDNEGNDASAVFSSANYSFCDWGEELVLGDATTTTTTTPRNGSPQPYGGPSSAMSTPAAPSGGTDAAGTAEVRRTDIMQHRYRFVMPQDLHPLRAARWAGGYPPLVTVLTFLVELLRRRALPLFDRGFMDQYPLLNYLYFKAVEEPTRDVFASFEGQLQLPLQPLGHQLSSGVYEVFERDARKYRQYREAIFSYVKDWFEAGPARSHARQNDAFFAQHGVMREVPMPSPDERVLHLVLLGCGRGPLIDECLNAVSALGVRLRLFAIEKNRPAAAFTRMRWANEPEWGQLAYTFGHTLEVIVADGRTIAEAARDGRVRLPPDFGLCDVVVSELLGSLGDNELSPECLEAFHGQLRQIQQLRGLCRNPYLTCIPQAYTAWVAPLMSASLEAAVAEAAVKGLTVASADCPDHHAALYHSLLVTNLSRGVTLADPQPCWTFTHDFTQEPRQDPAPATKKSKHSAKKSKPAAESAEETSMDRSARLTFTVLPCGRCSGVAGYFSCVLYASPTAAAVTLSTAPVDRTEDMYSWFPCTFTLDPTQQAELYDKEAESAVQSGAVAIDVHLARKTSRERRQVWYEWSVDYRDAAAVATVGTGDGAFVHNKEGWASSMLL